ncbi:MAG: hypothetical protein WD534_09445 [Phycisphaeraceae bacterium]
MPANTAAAWITMPMHELIHTTANAGRLLEKARRLAARDADPAAFLDPWLAHTQDYRGIRMLTMWARASEVAQFARQVGLHECTSDDVFDDPFALARRIERALRHTPRERLADLPAESL